MVELFSHRLMKCGFPKQFIHKHMLKFKDGDSHVTDQKLCKNIKKNIISDYSANGRLTTHTSNIMS